MAPAVGDLTVQDVRRGERRGRKGARFELSFLRRPWQTAEDIRRPPSAASVRQLEPRIT